MGLARPSGRLALASLGLLLVALLSVVVLAKSLAPALEAGVGAAGAPLAIVGVIYWRSRSGRVDPSNVNHEWTGSVTLFFGVRTAAECLYRDELDSYLGQPNFRVIYAFSREQTTADGRRMYVQHRMGERLDALRALLARDNSYLYICGLKGMEVGIEAVLAAPGAGGDEGVAPLDFAALKKSGRLCIEVY